MELRGYQERSLEELRAYLRLAAAPGKNAKLAFLELKERAYVSVAQLPELPYVCLRIPTGGGIPGALMHPTVGVTRYRRKGIWWVWHERVVSCWSAHSRGHEHGRKRVPDGSRDDELVLAQHDGGSLGGGVVVPGDQLAGAIPDGRAAGHQPAHQLGRGDGHGAQAREEGRTIRFAHAQAQLPQ